MKILFTINEFPVSDGSSIFLQGLSETLNRFGHNCIILTSDFLKKNKRYLQIKKKNDFTVIKIPFRIYNFILDLFSLKIKTNKLNKLIKKALNYIEWKVIKQIKTISEYISVSLIRGLFNDPFGWKLLIKLLITKTQDIDLIFTTPIPKSCVTASLIAARIKNIPIIIAPAYHFMLKDFYSNDKLWTKILRKFNLITTYTYAESDYLNNIGIPKKRLKNIGIGIPFHEINSAGPWNWREKLKIPKNQFVVLYINSLIADLYKGIETVIKASIKLSSISFIFVGRPKDEWERLVSKYNIKKSRNVYYIEYVSNEDKYRLFNAVNLIVRPSLNDSFGIIYLEGMSAGKPIITSNIEAMLEISKDVGISIPFGNVNKLVEAIKNLKNNKELYQKLSKNALIKSLGYRWENIAKKYEKSFQSLISAKEKTKKKLTI